MKSVIFEKVGKPEEVLEVKTLNKPTPAAGEVCIKVTACNINPSDIMFVQGMYGITPKLPSSAGFEGAGIIESCGEGVSIEIGTRVIFTTVGAWQEYVIVPAKTVIPTPPQMTDEVACQAFVNPFTAYGMLMQADVKTGEWVMLTAGASAYGKLVIQLAKQRGIKTLCTVRRDEQVEELLALGATAVIQTEKEKLIKRALEITDGVGVNYVFDAVGGTLGAKALSCLAVNGKMLVFGLLSLESIPLNSGLLIFKNLKVEGFWLTTWLESLSKEQKQVVFRDVLGGLATQSMKVDVADKFRLDQIKEAIRAYEKPGRTGKIILIP
ncbi:zinc-dependent alcohol dehydrogenase family protein [Penaeicola halotolerans]|uniref:zinc-dependent alcohol dehydrogenase family protein n=1 Tax=Penaeicola halotolerans TaxID=2793196 RepID=UPI001CF8156F|nr:zinc-dependent alcohol dehydrogenase family protein [Penaeicola halotolerans]